MGSSPDALRAEPLGHDARGGRYWFFGTDALEDCWLYREQEPCNTAAPPRKKQRVQAEAAIQSGSGWSAVSTTLEELQAFTEQLGVSEDLAEQTLAAVRPT